MKHTSRIWALLGILIIIVLAAGCGSQSAQPVAPAPTAGAPAAEKATAQPTRRAFGAASGGLDEADAAALLNAHNALRAKYGSPALVWDEGVAAVAQDWANTSAANASLDQRPDNQYGENSWAGTSGAFPLSSVVDSWGDGAKNFNLATGMCNEGASCWSFTQVIWANTARLGCGRATGDDGNDYVICDYDPPGNFSGESALAGNSQPTEVAVAPTEAPTNAPAEAPTQAPLAEPTNVPAAAPTTAAAENPTNSPAPTDVPAVAPTTAPVVEPTIVPTQAPANTPVAEPTAVPAPPIGIVGELTAAEKQAMLAKHNEWRARFNVPPLVWDDTVAAFSQSWANQLAATGNFLHSTGSGFGENLWAGGKGFFSAVSAVDNWGDEVQNYDLTTNKCAPGKVCGHFTQVVWRKTTKLGCARATGTDNDFIVCNYSPPGNFVGQSPFDN